MNVENDWLFNTIKYSFKLNSALKKANQQGHLMIVCDSELQTRMRMPIVTQFN